MPDLELSLLNSLKVLFSGLGAKNSDNNYAVPLFRKSDATPEGFMNLSDLASVLGDVQAKTQRDYTNIDSVHGNINVTFASSTPEIQSAWGSPSRYGILLCRKTGGNYEVQLYFAHGGANYGVPKMLYRTWNGDSWGSWYSVAFQS